MVEQPLKIIHIERSNSKDGLNIELLGLLLFPLVTPGSIGGSFAPGLETAAAVYYHLDFENSLVHEAPPGRISVSHHCFATFLDLVCCPGHEDASWFHCP